MATAQKRIVKVASVLSSIWKISMLTVTRNMASSRRIRLKA